MRYTILPATEADALELAPLLRAPDRAEIERLLGPGDPAAALLDTFRGAREAWTGRADGQIVGMFGVNPATLIGRIGVPWMLGSDLVPVHGPFFLRESKRAVPRMLALFPSLWNVVDATYAQALRWIAWMGFTIHPAQPLGHAGAPFCPFSLEAA